MAKRLNEAHQEAGPNKRQRLEPNSVTNEILAHSLQVTNDIAAT